MRDIELMEKLSSHPSLRVRVEEILNIAENVDGKAATADEAEDLAVEALRGLGREVLARWSEHRQREAEAKYEKDPAYERGGKKNSTGTVVWERLR